MPDLTLSRRRVLTLMAATASAPLLSRWGLGSPVVGYASVWSGTALGADARLVFSGVGAREADQHVMAALAEVDRLEAIFSLYRGDSEISRLNAEGRLVRPSPELLQVLDVSRRVHALSGGRFDPMVQTIWGAGKTMCQPGALRGGFAAIRMSRHEIMLPEGGAMTLNGIAQGYITERVTELLRRAGYRRFLVDMGETRTHAPLDDPEPWRIAMREGGQIEARGSVAIATSSANPLVLCAEQQRSHIVDPRTGNTPAYWTSVTVRHPSATWADALSTVCFLCPQAELGRVAGSVHRVQILARGHDGSTREWGSGS